MKWLLPVLGSVLLGLCGCGARDAVPNAGYPVATTLPPAPTPVVSLTPDELAKSLSVPASALVPLAAHPPTSGVQGWTGIYNQAGTLTFSGPNCVSSSASLVGHWSLEFVYDETASGGGEGLLDDQSLVIASAAIAAADQAQVATDAYASCYGAQVVRQGLVDDGGTPDGGTTYRQEPASLPVAAYSRLYTTPYVLDGAQKTDYSLTVWMRSGRLRSIVTVDTCCGVVTVSSVMPEISAVATAMKVAPG